VSSVSFAAAEILMEIKFEFEKWGYVYKKYRLPFYSKHSCRLEAPIYSVLDSW
jgi:hypothetical protein